MKWIYVETEVPNTGFQTIICDKHGNIQSAYYVYNEKLDKYDFISNDKDTIIHNVVYWTTLPLLTQNVIDDLSL